MNDGDIQSEESSCMLMACESTWVKVYPDDLGRIKQLGDLLISRKREGLLKIKTCKSTLVVGTVQG